MELIPLISIPVIYVGVAYIKPWLSSVMPWNICAICIAVSLTWIGLFIGFTLGMTVSPLVIGILMGMSVSGLMYKLEPFYKKKKVKNFWLVRLILIVIGFYGILMLIERRWGVFVPLAILGLVVIVIASFFFQGLTHEDVVKEAEKKKKSSLLKKLDNCC